jgi:hypothetical protein
MITWRALITLLLPFEIRVGFWIDFLEWISKPIRDIELSLIEARVALFKVARQNSQQISLAKLLADLTGRSFVITTNPSTNLPLTIYKRNEGQPPLYIRMRSETSDPIYIRKRLETVRDVDFTVSVSGLADDAITRIIISVVNRVKLGGKKYKIEYSDITITP